MRAFFAARFAAIGSPRPIFTAAQEVVMLALGGRSRYPRVAPGAVCAARPEGSRGTWLVPCPVSAKRRSSGLMFVKISHIL